MPKLYLPLPDVDTSVSRMVNLSIIRDVLKITNLKANTRIFYPGDLEQDAQMGSRLDDPENSAFFGSTEKVTIEVDEEYNGDRLATTAIHRPENRFFFFDDPLNVYLKPGYSGMNITINFKYRGPNKGAVMRWRDMIRGHVSMMQDVNLHTVDYHYLVPPVALYILKEIHRLRENVEGYNQTFDEYLKEHFSQRASILTTLDGGQDAWGISETQMRVQGYFDFEIAPEQGSKENESDAWTATFAYKFSYDKPIVCSMSYPLMIHNQPLSNRYRDSKKAYELEQQQRSYALSIHHLAQFEQMSRFYPLQQISGVSIPEVDDFIPSSVLPSTMRIVTGLVKIKESDKRTLIDLKELGKIKIIEPILSFLMTEAPYMTDPYKSVFHISAYKGIDLLSHKSITCNSDLIVSATSDLSMRDYHHVRLSLVTDLSLLDRAALDRLREHGCVFRLVMAALDSSLFKKGLLPERFCGGYVSRNDLDKILEELNRALFLQGKSLNRKTVETFYIQSNSLDRK